MHCSLHRCLHSCFKYFKYLCTLIYGTLSFVGLSQGVSGIKCSFDILILFYFLSVLTALSQIIIESTVEPPLLLAELSPSEDCAEFGVS